MAQANLIELNIPEAQLQEINAALETLTTNLQPHIVTLSNEDRRELPRMGDKTVAFVNKAKDYAQQYPELVPSYMDVSQMEQDLQGVQQLTSLMRLLSPLLDSLDDSVTLSGSEAHQNALVFYRSVKMAMRSGVPGAEAIYEDLANRFPGSSASASSTTTESETAEPA